MLHVLFVCEHNSARSQMAEAFLQQLGGEAFAVESCGLEAGTINPLVVEVMRELGPTSRVKALRRPLICSSKGGAMTW